MALNGAEWQNSKSGKRQKAKGRRQTSRQTNNILAAQLAGQAGKLAFES